MMNIFDTHAHYDDIAFDEDRTELLSSLPSKGVCNIINCGCSLSSCQSSLALSREYPFMYFACGIHPEDCESFGDITFLKESLIPFIEDKKCVAVGEIGDLGYEGTRAALLRYVAHKRCLLAKVTAHGVVQCAVHREVFAVVGGQPEEGYLESFLAVYTRTNVKTHLFECALLL